MEEMKTLNNTELKKAIAKCRGDKDGVGKIVEKALESHLYMPIRIKNGLTFELDEESIKENTKTRKLSLPVILHKEYGDMLPVFTDMDEYNEFMVLYNQSGYDPEHYCRPCVVSFRDLCAYMEDKEGFNGFYLDPCNNSLPFTREIIAIIKSMLQ